MLKRFVFGQPGYAEALAGLRHRGDDDLSAVESSVREILESVRSRGDAALRELTKRFEGRELNAVRMPLEQWKQQVGDVSPEVLDALKEAAERIRAYHLHQRESGFSYDADGVKLGMRVRPLASVGVYAPGGKASYPSTVLMTAVPAAVAGVKRIVLATPQATPAVLAAAEVAGVTEVIEVGGAQAIAALAFGTESVARVDKIVGPGNLYVACAKRLVFGTVDIDSIAGPSEVLVVADESANPVHVAADLLAQAEHDEAAYPLLITETEAQLVEVQAALREQLESLPRRAIASEAITANGYAFVTGSREESQRVASELASEHLCLSVKEPRAFFDGVEFAGAVFLGGYTPETAGDYAAGPSHVLPTGGAARFSSPLGVYDFVVRASMIEYSKEALAAQSKLLTTLAEEEGLHAHARAVTKRID